MRNKKEIEELKEKIKKLEDYNKYLERKKIGTQIIKEIVQSPFCLPAFTRDVYVVYADELNKKEQMVLIYKDCHVELLKFYKIIKEDDFKIFIKTFGSIIKVNKYNQEVTTYYPSETDELKLIVKEFENEKKDKQISKTRTKPKVNTNR